MSEKEKFQQLYIELHEATSEMKQLEKQKEVLESQLSDLVMTAQSLEDIDKVSPGTQILVPISSGIYAKAEIKENKKLLVNVGSNIVLDKGLKDTKKIIDGQISDLMELQKKVDEEMGKKIEKATSLEQEMNVLASAQGK